MYSEDDGTVEVCAVISGLPAGGLGTDVIVDFDVDGLSAGNQIVTVYIHLSFVYVFLF